ncbi:MAG TPA: hypothetical protein VJS92_13135 [Candidatus Polarisedimenticolaceae bacterium]|nr:hypothetical protein [Candidatus Polarisedimenticolaceae bacterium]
MSFGREHNGIAICLAAAGVVVCLVALLGFIHTVLTNNLPWPYDEGAREYYVAVGQSYSQGFLVGFFLCFFLSLAAVAVGAWAEQRRRRRSAPAPVPAPSSAPLEIGRSAADA